MAYILVLNYLRCNIFLEFMLFNFRVSENLHLLFNLGWCHGDSSLLEKPRLPSSQPRGPALLGEQQGYKLFSTIRLYA